MTTTRRRRRTNAERTASTRARILGAAATCLSQLGYAKTTTTIVAELAGVSRGALLHNFPTRAELVVATARHLFDQRVEEVRTLAAGVGEGTDRADTVIELLFAISCGPTADAALEVINAGRTNVELRPLVAELSHHFHRTIGEVFNELFPRPASTAFDRHYDAVPWLFMAILDGLAVQRAAGGPAAGAHAEILDLTKLLAHQLIAFPGSVPPEENCP